MRFCLFFLSSFWLAGILNAQDAIAGRLLFENRCARCHGSDANGGELGPAIANRLASRNDQQLAALIREGLLTRGMPPNPMTDAEATALIRHLRTLQAHGGRPVV